jgi:acetoin utilization protein AcuB
VLREAERIVVAMNVIDIMTEKPVTIRTDQKLRDALELMEQVGCHHLPVVGAEGHLVGVVSDRDCRMALNSPYIMREHWQDDDLAHRLEIRVIMTPAPIVVEPNTSAVEAARLMLANQIGCLPVMRSETLVGIITTSDILMAFVNVQRRIDENEQS